MSRFNLPLSISRKDLVGEFLLDWDPNDTSWNWNNWTATDVTWVATDKWYVKECWQWSNWDANITYDSITYKHSYIWIDWVFTKDSAAVTDTKLTLDDWKDYWLLRFYNRELTTNEELNLKLEWLRKLWPWLLQQYPELFKGCVWYWDFKNWELSNLTDWVVWSITWSDITLTTDNLWNSNCAYHCVLTDWNYIDLWSNIPSDSNSFTVWWVYKITDADNWWQLVSQGWTWTDNCKYQLTYYDNKFQFIVHNWTTLYYADSWVAIDWKVHTYFWRFDWTTAKIYIDWIEKWSVDVDWSNNINDDMLISAYTWWDTKNIEWDVSVFFWFNRALSQSEISKLHTLTAKKYIYPNPKYTPYSLPSPTLFINWNRDWDKFFDISWNWNDWTQSGWVTDWRIWQVKWMWFDGSNDYINVPINYDFTQKNEVTFISWVRILWTQDYWWVISSYTEWDNSKSFGSISAWHDSNWYKIWGNYIYWSDTLTWIWWAIYVDPNKYYFVVVTFKEWEQKIYIDWVLYNTTTNTWLKFDRIQQYWVNIWSYNWQKFLNIDVINPRIFSQALTPKQIEELYYAEKWNFIN